VSDFNSEQCVCPVTNETDVTKRRVCASGVGPSKDPAAMRDGHTGPDGRPCFSKPDSKNGFHSYARLPGRPLAIDSFTDCEILMERSDVYKN
jgi:hypothetical protein